MRYSLILLLIIQTTVSAQVSISGKVLADESGEPISGASVYINNSTIGTTTGENGEYRLTHILPGTYDIIISHIGYEPLMHRVEIKSADLRFTFRLDAKAKLMRDILVMTKDQRKAKMKIFRDQFIGITLAADRSGISNEEDVLFEAGEERTSFKAFTEVPLVIINKELGYRINFELQEFYFDQITGRTYFYGFARYEELEKGNHEKWRKKREKYYLGSTMHLYHSLSAGNAEEQGFIFYKISDLQPGGSPDAAKAMLKSHSGNLVFMDTVLHKKYLDWKGDIMVQYDKDPYYKFDLAKKVMMMGSLPHGIRTTIRMLESPAYLDANGILENPLAVQYSGFWSYERLANMLPVDYKPSR